MSNERGFSRRNFLRATGITGAAVLTGAVAAPTAAEAQHVMVDDDERGRAFRGMLFFQNNLDFATLSEAAERIYPKDETGPGAIDLAVPYFIDNQLASAYGHNIREYTAGPYFKGAPTQGPQSALLRKDIMKEGLDALNKYSNATYKANFPDLTAAQKDQALKDCQAGKIETSGGFTSAEFFSQLQFMVIAGVYADPAYNGNNNMDGWRAKGFPGAQMSYIGVVDNPEFQKMEPMAMGDM